MRELRLLERIAALETGQIQTQATRAQVLVVSIREHLQRILNTRRGSVPLDPEFGVPDFTNLAGSFSTGSTREIIDSITRMIERYEPRLKAPKVQVSEQGSEVLSLSFSLEGVVQVDDHELPIRLATSISSSGRVSLQAQ
ncbi:type VI secretion system baseplate subunit TssE [Alcaligenes sp. SDU_A2]|uniref:type VI secretion system baseplate subunit TssE n=1 Tax=Alcaligenes sp. SDU_A2 TaxID=3136634 RepID=UPI002CC40041|nr:type VI secretion system baseplate subunit TssE [Alcaligenes sp.]HRL28008.1 type VI secretion system baseplate subunit TssE [Alcaligenes sp.]